MVLSLTVLAQADDPNAHVLRFFLDPNLVGSMSTEQLQSNIAQYAVDINSIFAKQTTRRMVFDPNSGTTITAEKPHTDLYPGLFRYR